MFELPEYIHLSEQINEILPGKIIKIGQLGNKPHKFVWYNRTHEEFKQLTQNKTVGKAKAQGRWLFIPLEPGYVLVFGECGGKILYHEPDKKLPSTYHLAITFQDGSHITATTQMWGAMELYEKGKEYERQYIKNMKTTPIDPEFTFDYFSTLIETLIPEKKRSVKGLLTQDQLIPGLGNAIAQDIMFIAGLHPRHPIDDLSTNQRHALYKGILTTIHNVIERGGRYDEYNLYNKPGQYIRLMDKNAAGHPCPNCGTTIKKIQYLGGACYFCPSCQN